MSGATLRCNRSIDTCLAGDRALCGSFLVLLTSFSPLGRTDTANQNLPSHCILESAQSRSQFVKLGSRRDAGHDTPRTSGCNGCETSLAPQHDRLLYFNTDRATQMDSGYEEYLTLTSSTGLALDDEAVVMRLAGVVAAATGAASTDTATAGA